MSQKFDASGTLLGAYGRDDLEACWFPELYRKGKRRVKLRRLDYDLVWDITEMQVKIHIRAVPQNTSGPLTTQLAKERRFEAHEKLYTGESRSRGLKRDIEISHSARSMHNPKTPQVPMMDNATEILTDLSRPDKDHPVFNSFVQQNNQQESSPAERTPLSSLGPRETDSTQPHHVSHLQSKANDDHCN